MKTFGVFLILFGALSMFYDTIVYGNFNLNGIIMWIGVLFVWYSMREKPQIRPTLFNKG